MIKTSILFSLLASCVFSSSPSLKVTYGTSSYGVSSFIALPIFRSEASEAGWVQVTRPEGPSGLSSLILYCPISDYTLCTMYDDTDYIAGLQIALDQGSFSNAVFGWEDRGFTNWSTTVSGEEKNYWATQQYFICEEILATKASARIAARDNSTILQEGTVWLTSFNGDLDKVPTNTSNLSSVYKKQGCYDGMGYHNMYNMTNETSCVSENMMPWLVLSDGDVVIGTSFITFGQADQNWLETPTLSVVEVAVPNGPQCFFDLVESVGLVTLHIYYTDEPYNITCDSS